MRTRALAAVALAMPAALGAQRRDSTVSDTTRLAPIEVIGSILPPSGPTVRSGIPARASVVAGERLDAWQPRVLADALAVEPGITIYDDLGSPFKTTLVSRGFTVSPVVGLPQGISVFVDGIPVNEPDAGQVNFDLLPLDHVRQVELLSGTASLLGPNSLGGAINLVTRRGGGPPSGGIELSGGSYGALGVEGSVAGGRNGWSYYAGASHDREDGWRQLTSAELTNGLGSVAYLRGASGIRLQLYGGRSYAETAGSLPTPIFETNPDSNLTAGDFEELDQIHIATTGFTPLAGGRGSLALYYRAHDAERFNVNQAADPDVRSFSENRTLGLSADWQRDFALERGALSLRVGATGSVNDVDIRIFAERVDPGLTTHVETPIRDGGIYTVADWEVGPVTASAGLRYDVVRIPFRNELNPARDTTSTFDRLSPRAGIAVRIGDGSIYGSAGQSFRAPAVIELACADPQQPCPLPFALGDDPPLDPVLATTFEIGGQWLRGASLWTVAAYRTNLRGEIFLLPYDEAIEPDQSTIDGFFANIGKTRREGIELGTQYAIGPLSAYANYAFARATFRTDDIELFSIRGEDAPPGVEVNEIEVGDELPLVPNHLARAGMAFDMPRGISSGIDVRWTGEQWLRGDEANEEAPLPGYATVDLRAGFASGGWEIQGIVYNLFDAGDAVFGTFNIDQNVGQVDRFLTPAAPRSVRLVLRRSFGR